MSTTAPAFFVADDPLFEEHRSRGYHPERPERLGAARRAVERCAARGMKPLPLPPRDATDDEILRAHTPEHLALLARLAGRHAALDPDTYLAPASVPAARRAAGAVIELTAAILEGRQGARQGVALVRPPGHHATRDQGMGFCLLNNIAIAAHAALAKGASRVAIVDWDVHHGNGTQDVFWEDDRVLFVSLHEMPLYPGTGATREIGEGRGRGYTINVPLSAAANDAVYGLAFQEIVLPALRWYRPDLILVSAGFDAHERDPLASMHLGDEGYGWMASALARLPSRRRRRRAGLVLEGGYDLTAIEASLAAAILGITGGAPPPGAVDGAVSVRHREEIAAARQTAEAARPEGRSG
jgi:acetoin utilization deacetylase AcuC-like enzyme